MAKKNKIKKSETPIKKAKNTSKNISKKIGTFNKNKKSLTSKIKPSLKDKNANKEMNVKQKNNESVKKKGDLSILKENKKLANQPKSVKGKIKNNIVKSEDKTKKGSTTPVKKQKISTAKTKGETKKTNIIKPKVDKKKKVDYTTKTFCIVSETIGFLKITKEQYGVRLSKGVNIKKCGELNYELRGKNPDGSDFGTMFDCVDKAESDKFFSELIDYLKSGDVEIVEEKIDENKDDEINKDSKHYKGIPIETKKMNDLIGIINNGHDEISNAPIVENQTSNQSIQPPISETHTPFNTSNPTIPSQNPQLYYDEIQNKQDSIASNTCSSMESYGNTILETVNQSFQVRIQGTMALSDFKTLINACSKEFNYDIRHDGHGYFLEITKDEQKIRIPNNEYLRVS